MFDRNILEFSAQNCVGQAEDFGIFKQSQNLGFALLQGFGSFDFCVQPGSFLNQFVYFCHITLLSQIKKIVIYSVRK